MSVVALSLCSLFGRSVGASSGHFVKRIAGRGAALSNEACGYFHFELFHGLWIKYSAGSGGQYRQLTARRGILI